jgi:hypothetical protein
MYFRIRIKMGMRRRIIIIIIIIIEGGC